MHLSLSPGLIWHYERLWADTILQTNEIPRADIAIARMLAHREAYDQAVKHHPAPWWIAAIIHALEGDADFERSLADGEPLLNHESWVVNARAALFAHNPAQLAHWTWTCIHEPLAYLEGWNGWGFLLNHPGVPSPYLWDGTYHERAGRYTWDGHFEPMAVSRQVGAVLLLMRLAKAGVIEPLRSAPQAQKPVAAGLPSLLFGVESFSALAAGEVGWYETLRFQQFLNTLPGPRLVVDGQYGPKTDARFRAVFAAVKLA